MDKDIRRNRAEPMFDFEDENQPASGIYVARRRADYAHHRGARRKHRRWVLDAQVRVPRGEQKGDAEGVALNASAGGLRVALDRPLDADAFFTVELEGPSGPTRCRARVVWCRESGGGFLSGLAFARPDARFVDAASFRWAGHA